MTSSTMLSAPLRTSMLTEYADWSRTHARTGAAMQTCGHGCLQPRHVTGVPHGWVDVAHLCVPDRGCCHTLTCGSAGGWGLIQTADTDERTNLVRATDGLDDLYASVRFVSGPAHWKHGVRVGERTTTRRLSGPFPLLTDWLTQAIAAMYDPNDEAAVQMLFLLSGDLRQLPKAVA